VRLSCYTAQKLFELQNIHSKHHKVSFNLNPHIYFLHISNFLRYPSASSFFSVASRAQPSRIISNSFGLRFGNLTIVDPDLDRWFFWMVPRLITWSRSAWSSAKSLGVMAEAPPDLFADVKQRGPADEHNCWVNLSSKYVFQKLWKDFEINYLEFLCRYNPDKLD